MFAVVCINEPGLSSVRTIHREKEKALGVARSFNKEESMQHIAVDLSKIPLCKGLGRWRAGDYISKAQIEEGQIK